MRYGAARSLERRITSVSRSAFCATSVSRSLVESSRKCAVSAHNAPSLKKLVSSKTRWYSTQAKPIAERIAEQVKAAPVVVYMKGTPKSPQCGFSRAVVDVLRREHLAKYDYYNILEDEELRQGIKDYSNWPTIPQVYIGGEFVGGCDIILDMHGEGTLMEALQKAGADIQEH